MPEALVENDTGNISVLPKPSAFDSSVLVEQWGDYLFRFAVSRVRDESLAEDLVQETFLAALGKLHTFSNRSSLRTWLTSILKHKISDHFRRSAREDLFDSSDSFNERFFQPDGSWKPGYVPSAWNEDPAAAVENQEFWKVVNRALTFLPDRTASAFVLREVEGRSSEEICRLLRISKNNLWVMLHRARLFIRHEVEVKFFMVREKN